MSERAPHNRFLIVLCFVLLYVIWGSTYLAIRVAVTSLPPFLMAAARFFIAGGLLALFAAAARGPRPTFRQWRSALVVGGLLFTTGNGFVCMAEQTVSSGVAALLIATVSIFMVLLGAFVFRTEPLRPAVLLGLALGMAGVTVLVDPFGAAGTAHGGVDRLGAALLGLAAFSWALGTHLSRRLELPECRTTSTAVQMLGGAVLLLVFAAARGEFAEFDSAALTPPAVVAVLYLAIPGAIVAYSAYVYLLGRVSVAAVSTYAFVNPLVAVALGVAILDEPMNGRLFVAMALIIGAVVLLQVTRLRPPPAAPCSGAEAGDDRLHPEPAPAERGVARDRSPGSDPQGAPLRPRAEDPRSAALSRR